MGKAKKTQPAGAKKATATGKGSPSKAYVLGRRLKLELLGEDNPLLHKIEFQYDESSRPSICDRRTDKHFPKKLSQVLALFILDYSSAPSPEAFYFSGKRRGSLAATLGDVRSGLIHDLFRRLPGSGGFIPCLDEFLHGKNIGGGEDKERILKINTEFLPPDCIEVSWEGKTPDDTEIKLLAKRIRGILEPDTEPELTEKEAESPSVKPLTTNQEEAQRPEPTISREETAQGLQSESENMAEPETKPGIPPTENPKPVEHPNEAADELRDSFPTEPSESEPDEPTPKEDQEENPRTSSARVHRPFSSFKSARKSEPEEPPAPPIDESLLTIHNPCGYSWEDFHPLLDLGEDDESEDDIWRLKDACEGILILGAPSSGKTSSSAFAIAASFLQAGFGGLVLTAKTDEARRWKRLCSHFGREEDCIVVTPNGPHKLNALAYETQRAKGRIGLTDDLISFFRVLIAIVSKRPSHHGNDDFWVNSTNQLMRNLFDVFLLAQEPMSIDSLMRFINQAPKKPTDDWQSIPYFGLILQKAKMRVGGQEDMRIFKICLEYWTVAYPNIADATRSGITTGFSAMAATLSGRGIHDLISTDTTLTPESSVLSGKIVVLDLALKECGQGALLIQGAWKYLLQRAIERRADKGLKTAIPCFLWEDEGHLFFSQHDIDFQPTARDCRCAHVVISQNLHNFYQLGHSSHAVQGVFAAMNFHVFHSNGSLETNKWAAERLGTAVKTRVNVSISSQPKQEQKHWFWDAFKPDGRQSSSSASTTQQRENIVQPEDFSKLKKGGDGTAEAIVLWVSHRFKANKNLPFCRKLFAQDNINHQ